MRFNDHHNLTGRHAFLSASKSTWIRYTFDKLDASWRSHRAAAEGSELHDIAATLIRKGIKLPKSSKTLNRYVNDAIGFKMQPEQILFATDFAFGTADAIGFNRNILRISDLKSGVTPAHMDQLRIYAAYFCMEYDINPMDITIELRIYQNDQMIMEEASAPVILGIMDTTRVFSKRLEEHVMEELA